MKWKKELHTRWQRTSHRVRLVLLSLVLVLVAFRLVLPYGIEWYVNRQLQRAPEYGGRIGTVNVHLWRGAYQIRDIRIFKKAGKVQESLFAASLLDLSIEWRQLFHGAVVGEVVMQQPALNFVSGPTEEQTQSGKDARWDQMLESLFPFKLNRLEIIQGEVHFQNHFSQPPVDIFIKDAAIVATNLTNARDVKDELPAGLSASGSTLGGGGLDLQLRLNLLADPPAFELTCQVSNVNLVSLNDFLLAYGKFDVERGTFGLYTSVAAKNGNYEGYFKPFFENLDVFDWQKESTKNVFQTAWQAVVGGLAVVFKNQSTDSLATKVPISGTFKKGEVGVLRAIGTLLRNAFVQALVPRVDEKVTVQQVEQKTETKEPPDEPAKKDSP